MAQLARRKARMTTENKKVTITHIAKMANVSPSTVSRVLRGSAEVSEAKREAIQQAIEALQYRPNIFAQSLASGQSMTIGVLTQNFGSPFYDGILQGILQGLEGSDYWPMFADGRWYEKVEKHALHLLLDRRVDGLIIIGGQLDAEMLQSILKTTPLVVVAREISPIRDRCLYVNNYEAGYAATRYLIDMGHRHIAHITAPTINKIAIDDVEKRFEGYKQALTDASLPVDSQLIMEGNLLQQSGVLAVEMLLSRGRPFSAIFAANDQMAFGARLALYRRGIRVPEDVSLVGVDDEPSAAYIVPPLTTVRQPAVEMGQRAAQAILAFINGKTPDLSPFKAHLVVRESVSRYR